MSKPTVFDQEWGRSDLRQLEAFDVPVLLSMLYKEVADDLQDATDKGGTSLEVGQIRFSDNRLEWGVSVSSSHGYLSEWGATLKGALINLVHRYHIRAWEKSHE